MFNKTNKKIVSYIFRTSRPTGPTDLILDEYGRTVDARGRVIQLPKFVPTIKVGHFMYSKCTC